MVVGNDCFGTDSDCVREMWSPRLRGMLYYDSSYLIPLLSDLRCVHILLWLYLGYVPIPEEDGRYKSLGGLVIPVK